LTGETGSDKGKIRHKKNFITYCACDTRLAVISEGVAQRLFLRACNETNLMHHLFSVY
jgi:hypothetical protein